MPETALVQVENLSRFYQNHKAINHLSFELQPGEVLGFLGPNGAGKSTTMQIISGNLAPSEGRVRINGHDIIESPREAKQQIGYLPEHPPIYRESTVDEYLTYCAQLRRVPRADIAGALAQAKQDCGLVDVARRLIGNLSKGYQQRVGIAQAIIHNPPVIILDEPTVGLDPIQIREIRSLIKALGGNRSVILSTHILSEVQATCDRVQIIRRGELIYNAPIAALKPGNHSSFSVAWQQPPSSDTLLELDTITRVESLDDNRFRLFYDHQSPAQQIVELSVRNNWGLFELVPDQQSLEDIFIELTANESLQPLSGEAST